MIGIIKTKQPIASQEEQVGFLGRERKEEEFRHTGELTWAGGLTSKCARQCLL